MENKNSLTCNGLTPLNFLSLCLSIGMIFVGVYLTNHFFDTVYPTGITGESTLCNISDFWGCDKATLSPLGVIAGMPTSIFGVVMGIIGVLTSLTRPLKIEQVTKTALLINFVACVILFIYSLAVLKSLCPMCTAYYILSAFLFFLYHKYSSLPYGLDLRVASLFLVILLVPLVFMNYKISVKEGEKASLANSYVAQFNSLKNYGPPTYISDYKIHMASEKFADAPLRITVFSDFQCPYCKVVAEQMPELVSEFKDKINIQYMFYPLDPSCNKEMKGGLHAHACNAAYLAACEQEKFVKVHDYIFQKQNEINSENLKLWAKKFELSESCLKDENIQDKVQQTLNAGTQYNLRSTPTMIINGRKIEGVIPSVHLKPILRSLLKNE